MNVTLEAWTPMPMSVVERAACNCYNSEPTSDYRIAKGCYYSGHTSVFEHISFTFKIEGVSRSLLAQLTRHRIASYTVESQRYVQKDSFTGIVPNKIRDKPNANLLFEETIEVIADTYKRLIDMGIEPEDARAVLPNACDTRLTMTINVRSLMNFCNERLCTNAQAEIRELANKMRDLVVEVAPELSDMLVPKCEKNRYLKFCSERQCCGRNHTEKAMKEIIDNHYRVSAAGGF